MSERPMGAEPEAGGDPACWANLVCPECGGVTSEGHQAGCSRAGEHPADDGQGI